MPKKSPLSEQLMKLKNKLFGAIKSIVSFTVELASYVVLIGLIIYGAARAPEIHGQWLRSSVGKKVYTIRWDERSGGGTGFAVKAPSGQSYILTNDHVCGVSQDGQTVLVSNEDGLSMRRRIIERSDFSDLCLIEGIPNVQGLSLGSSPAIGQIVGTVGHPSLMPITLSRGEIITAEDVMIGIGPVAELNPETNQWEQISPMRGGVLENQCKQKKNEIIETDLDFGFFSIRVKYCVVITKKAYRTNMLIQPGNSGSPMVNFWGNLTGVMFASDRYNWGIAVSLDDVKRFLKHY